MMVEMLLTTALTEGRREMNFSSLIRTAAVGAIAAFAGSVCLPASGYADVFNLTSCHISTGCPAEGTVFGTVTLNQSGGNVVFDVVLLNGSRFVETGAGGNSLFLFNDSIAGSTVINASATLNGVTQSLAISGSTNQPPIHADGTGDFTAAVFCTTASECNGGSTPNINDLHFTVTNATIAQLTTANANGNIFVADILCGATVVGCAGNTGPVDVTGGAPVPGPILGGGLPGLVIACGGLIALARRRRQQLLA
jgi:hypothetical protein